MQPYFSSSPETRDDNGELLPEFSDMDIWHLVGCTPFILSLDHIMKLASAWSLTEDEWEKAIGFLSDVRNYAEEVTYKRFTEKHGKPSKKYRGVLDTLPE